MKTVKLGRKAMALTVILMVIVMSSTVMVSDMVRALPWDNPGSDNLYMRSDTITVNSQLGYVLNTTRSLSDTSVSSSKAGSHTTYWGVRAWIRQRNNATSELTDGSYGLNVSRAANGTGFQNVTFTPDTTTLNFGSDSLVVGLYIKVGADAWAQKAIFTTVHLETLEIQNATWTFRLYTNYTDVGGITYGVFHWGDLTYLSRIEGFQYTLLKPWEKMLHDMTEGNWFNALLVPWTYFIGDMIYGVALLGVAVTLYNRYNDVRPIIVMTWIFGGTGGFLTLLIPAVSLPLAWFLIAFALATTLYVLFK